MDISSHVGHDPINKFRFAKFIADRLRHVTGSPTLALAAKAKALANAGKPVLDFTAGEPDFPTPEPINGTIRLNNDLDVPPELRQWLVASFEDMVAKAKRMALRHGVATAGDRVIVCAGVPFGTPGSTNVLHVVTIVGDELKGRN